MLESGTSIKHFTILKELGEGGMGKVYLAEDSVLGRKVALKFLGAALQSDADARQRFIREAKAAASLDHPFICKVYEIGEVDGKAYIAMEYVEGRELAAMIKDGPVALQEAVRIAADAATALAVAHKNGTVHRDLKPANIMVTDEGFVKVMDFGLAKQFVSAPGTDTGATRTEVFATQAGVIIGTAPYMSPEQAKGVPLTGASDVFALGIILHELLTGKHPFPGQTIAEVISSILRDDPPPLTGPVVSVPHELEDIVLKALSKDPASRYENAGEMAADLKALLEQPSLERKRKLSVPRIPPAFIAVAAVAVVVFSAGVWWASRPASEPAAPAAEIVVPTDPVAVLIADFANNTGNTVFDAGALEMSLGMGLGGASNVTVFDRLRAHEIGRTLDPAAGDRLDADLATLVSRSEGLNVVVAGTIDNVDDGMVISVRAVDPVTAEVMTEVSQTIADASGVLLAADALATELRAEISGLPAESLAALSQETFTTTSLAAMSAYTRAQAAAHEGRLDEAITEYETAVQEDPEFGRAYAGLATIYYNRGEADAAASYYQLAMANIDRMTEREKYRTRGGYYLLVKDYDNAINEYDALAGEYPNDPAGAGNLAFAHFLARNMDQAVESGLQAVQIAPDNLNAHFNLAWFALYAGNNDLAEQEANAVLSTNPGFAEAHLLVGLAQLARGELDAVAQTYADMVALGDRGASLARLADADLAVYEGRLSDAASLLRMGIGDDAASGSAGSAGSKLAFLADVLLQSGQTDQAVAMARQARSSSGSEGVQLSAALTLAGAGETGEAMEIAGELGNRLQPEPQAYAKLIEGEVALIDGDAVRAVGLMREAGDLLDTWIGRYGLGRAFLEAGAFPNAHAEFEGLIKRSGEASSVFVDDLPSYRYLPPVYYYMGRAQEGLGSAGATDSYNTFLGFKSGDEDPLVVDARARVSG